MDSVKRKVISELYFAPSVVLPILGGIAAGLWSWTSGGSIILSGAAALGILGGVGWMVTRMIFKVEDITEAAMQAQRDRQLRLENVALDELASRLRTDRDHRTQDNLTLLRSLRSDFEAIADQTGIRFQSAQVREQVGHVFGAAVQQLERSFRCWELSQKLSGQARDNVLHERENVLAEVDTTVKQVEKAIKQFEALARSETDADLGALSEELEATMRIAKRTEERMREIENPSADYEAFVKE